MQRVVRLCSQISSMYDSYFEVRLFSHMSMQEQISTELANETVSSQAAIVFPPLGVKYCWVCTAVLPWGGSPLDGFLGHRSKACVFSPQESA